MPEPARTPPAADRNLLFGILALQLDFISRDALVAAMNAWVLDKGKGLGQILLAQGALVAERLALLEALVAEHLKAYQNDLQQSLAALSSIAPVRQELRSIADGDLQASLALAGSEGADDPEATGPHIAQPENGPALRYRILRPHAKGGLGEVFVAEDQELHREVALKQIQEHHAHNPANCARFLLEAEITGGLEHPGVVPVYGLGQYADGRPFYAMRFIKGDNLKEGIRRFHEADVPGRDPGDRNLALRQLLRRFIDVCNAVAYAHSRGVLHRDLKPGNIMLGKYGETLVVDWGLAKPVERSAADKVGEEPTLQPSSGSGLAMTVMGTAIGTPAYMSPEQAAGRLELVGPSSDIYSLGATLYSLLTGKAPFDESDKGALLQRVQQGDWLPPRQVKPDTPPALDAICRKAMALKPEDRYTTALALAADLEHWLADEPVSAYRESLSARLARWARRHRPLVTGAAALLLTAVAALSLGVVLLRQANKQTQEQRDRAEGQHEEAVSNLYHSWVREAQALRRARESGYRAKVFDRLKKALQLETPDKDPLELRQEAAACLGDFVGLEPTIWEDFSEDIISSALHPDGTQLAMGLRDGTVLLRCLSDSAPFATLKRHHDGVTDLRFWADGRELVSMDRTGQITVWQRNDAGTWTCRKAFTVQEKKLRLDVTFPFFTPRFTSPSNGSAALTPDGRHLAVSLWETSTIVLVDLADGTTAARFLAPEGAKIWRLAISPDGKLLAGGYKDRVLVWDVASRTLAQTILPELDLTYAVCFSPDSRLLACVHGLGVALYDTSTFQRYLLVRGDLPCGVTFSHANQLLAIHSWQLESIRLWNISTNREVARLACGGALWMRLEFSKDDKVLVAPGMKSVRTWNLAGASEKLVLGGHVGGVPDVVFSPDGKLLASAGKDHKLKIWDPVTGDIIKELTDFSTPVQTLCFSPDGRVVAAGDYYEGMVRFHDVQSGKVVHVMEAQVGGLVWSIAFSPDGQHFAAGGDDGLTLWRVVRGASNQPATNTISFQLVGRLAAVASSTICFSPDGNWLAWVPLRGKHVSELDDIHLWDLRNSQPQVLANAKCRFGVLTLGFYPDSKHLAFVSDKPSIAVWDVTTKQEAFSFGEGELERRGALPPHTRLSADGAWYALGNRTITVWDMAAKNLLVTLPGERSVIWSVGWSPNRELLAAGTSDGNLVIWNLTKVRARLAETGLGW